MNTRKPVEIDQYHEVWTESFLEYVSGFTSEQLDKISFAAESELIDRENKAEFDGESQ